MILLKVNLLYSGDSANNQKPEGEQGQKENRGNIKQDLNVKDKTLKLHFIFYRGGGGQNQRNQGNHSGTLIRHSAVTKWTPLFN
jgi:hypothetical protein